MASKSSNPQRFNDYLDGLREEFELLTDEFNNMKKMKDDLESTIKSQRQELERIRQAIDVLVNQSASLENQIKSQQPANTYPLLKYTSAQPSQSNTEPTVIPPSLAPESVFGDSNDEEGLVTFNNEAEKELDVTLAYTLFHGQPTWCVNFSADGKYLAVARGDGKACIIDVRTGIEICVLRNLLAENDCITAVCFSPDGKHLATGTSKGYICIWVIDKKSVRNAFKGHTYWIRSLDFAWHGGLLVSTSIWDDTVRLWNMRHGATKLLIDDNPNYRNDPHHSSAVFSPDGKFVAATHHHGIVRIWDVRTGQLMRRMKTDVEWVFNAVFTPNRKGLISGNRDNTLKYWDISSLYAAGHGPGVEEQTRPVRIFSGHEDSVRSLAISPGGRWVASGSEDKSVRIWDTQNGTVQRILDHNHWVLTLDFNPNLEYRFGRLYGYFATAELDGPVRVWEYSYRDSVPFQVVD